MSAQCEAFGAAATEAHEFWKVAVFYLHDRGHHRCDHRVKHRQRKAKQYLKWKVVHVRVEVEGGVSCPRSATGVVSVRHKWKECVPGFGIVCNIHMEHVG